VTTQTATAAKLPFKEAIAHTKQKTAVARPTYYDLPGEVHDRAFMVAGLAKEDVLADLKAAVGRAIAEGKTVREFQKEFDQIIKDRWDPKGGSAWRARVILETNMRTAYAAGRYKQLDDMVDTHPYWQYRHGASMKPRADHLAMDGVVLRADDPWWDRNYPPNGWGCQCYVTALTEGRAMRSGRITDGSSLPDLALDPTWQHAHGMHTTYNPNSEPRGLPGQPNTEFEWKPLEEWMEESRPPDPAGEQTEKTPGKDEKDAKKPEQPTLPPKAEEDKGKELRHGEGENSVAIHELPQEEQRDKAIELVKKELLGGADRAVLDVKCGEYKAKLAVNAAALVGHFIEKDPRRIALLGYLPDLLSPQEVRLEWLVSVDKNTGQRRRRGPLVLRHIAVTRINHPKYKGAALVYQNNGQGEMAAWTFLPLREERNIRAMLRGQRIAKAY
jgi:SPP1 gp7 family putative phage head morphogenesis protein